MKKNSHSTLLNGCNGFCIILIFMLFLTTSCAGIRQIDDHIPVFVDEEWIIPDGPVQELRDRTWDLQHQKLWVRFDFEHEEVLGRTELLLTAMEDQSELVLDAKTMEFDSIYDVSSHRHFTYEQDSAIVTIDLDASYSVDDTLLLGIDFISRPPQRGLYFVNPRGEDPVKPTQIWTLGQPEDNSFWFPTIDHPSERTTQETWISVPPEYTTLSNGLLLESRVHSGDSLRTDYWRLNQPHAPYLFALAVGKYEVTEEVHGDILYRYYTEPEFAGTVDLIYENTVDMLQYAEEKTGMAYPWDPVYSQAPVHDFIARGMENTTATLLYDAVQFDRRASQDLSNQGLVMHEIIHQWLGNVVTAKDWANLPLNEGFANYFESSYRRHNDGEDPYLWKVQNDRISYFNEAGQYRRPVIFNRYRIPEDMYDRHTYQKSGQILRMLHHYMGDEQWWEGVRLWLEKFSYDAVDINDLQGVYEGVHGEDLDWFFQQWFLEPGHPYLDISREIENNRARLTVAQVQDTTRQPVFRLHPEVLIRFADGEQKREQVRVDEMVHEFLFEYEKTISDVIVDPDRVQLAEYYLDIDSSAVMTRLESEHLLIRSETLSILADELDDPGNFDIVTDLALNDPFWGIRKQALELIGNNTEVLPASRILDIVRAMTHEREKNHEVRREALYVIGNMELTDNVIKAEVREHLEEMRMDTSYFVTAEAILLSGEKFPDEISGLAGPFITIDSYQDVIKNAVSEALTYSESTGSRELLMQLAEDPGEKEYTYIALEHLSGLIQRSDSETRDAIKSLFVRRLDDPYAQYRIQAYDAMAVLGASDQLDKLQRIKERNNLSEDERDVLRRTIRSLEYELELN